MITWGAAGWIFMRKTQVFAGLIILAFSASVRMLSAQGGGGNPIKAVYLAIAGDSETGAGGGKFGRRTDETSFVVESVSSWSQLSKLIGSGEG
jgi:hypothetical protein